MWAPRPQDTDPLAQARRAAHEGGGEEAAQGGKGGEMGKTEGTRLAFITLGHHTSGVRGAQGIGHALAFKSRTTWPMSESMYFRAAKVYVEEILDDQAPQHPGISRSETSTREERLSRLTVAALTHSHHRFTPQSNSRHIFSKFSTLRKTLTKLWSGTFA